MKMKHILWISFLIVTQIQNSDGGCPRATFEFSNYTKKATYNFIDSSVGNIGSLETCPYTGRPYVYLPCYPNSSWGNEPYFSGCSKPLDKTEQSTPSMILSSILPIDNPYSSMSVDEISKLSMESSNDVSNVLSYLNRDTITFQTSADVASVVNIIDHVTTAEQNTTDEVHSVVYSVANKILSSKSIEQAQKTNRSVVKLLSSLETFSQNMKSNQFDATYVQDNLAVSIVNMPNNRTKPIIGFEFDAQTNRMSPIDSADTKLNSTTIILDSQTASQQNRLAFSVFNPRNSLFDDQTYHVLTRVISLTIDKPELIKSSTNFVKMNFHIERDDLTAINGNLTCAYWHIFDNNMTAQWSTTGCRLIDIQNHNVMCECNHLTHFAVLLDIQQTPVSKEVEQLLSIITLGGLLLSSVGLCLTILTFVLFKKLRRHFSQKSLLLLSINLLLVNILFSVTILRQLEDLLCIIIASLLHYFVLSSFSWMFILALIQYLLFVKVFPRSISAFTRKAAVFAQFVPAIPVIVVLSLDPWNYHRRKDNVCWLSYMPLYLSFILPVGLYIFINSILFCIVARSLLCGKTGQQLRSTQVAESQRLSRFFVALSCFVVLGLTWIFGFFVIGPVRLLFQILFCTFATLTGFLIFILYIVTSKAKRTCWSNALKSAGIPSIYSPTLSSSSALAANKEFSTSSTTDQTKVPSRLLQFSSQPQHFIDAYMPSSPPAPAPPLPLPPPFLIEGDDPLNATTLANSFYEPNHIWIPQANYNREINQPTTLLDDYSLFYASNHDATKL
ncbi:unnamed protein product [Adineta ricciae]|uniref:Uncharacterized protein n=1 Tax=Adineta ricciae TaxID=249248 RepID=A0A814HYL1_ADIRI|nr:unnamed protein product [Adineta ricciae]